MVPPMNRRPFGKKRRDDRSFKKRPHFAKSSGPKPPHRPQRDDEPGRWVYGRHVVEESLAGQAMVHVVCIAHGHKSGAEPMIEAARRKGATLRWVGNDELDKISMGGAHHGFAARIAEREGKDLDGFLAGLSEAEKKGCILVALDELQDPHNFGAIARSAACLGARGLLTTEYRSASITQSVLASSAGAIQKIPSFKVTNLTQSLNKLKDAGFWIYGADGAGVPSWKAVLNRPMVLVIGSEGKGIRPLVKSVCHELVAIPHGGGVASLNASCAASILLYEAVRQARA